MHLNISCMGICHYMAHAYALWRYPMGPYTCTCVAPAKDMTPITGTHHGDHVTPNQVSHHGDLTITMYMGMAHALFTWCILLHHVVM